MNIQGLQKLTLLDYPGKTACTIFTGGCNLRCPFCHNAVLVLCPNAEEGHSEEEIIELLRKRRGILDGIAITGGEPLLQKDILSFMKRLKDEGVSVKLDTNGAYPEKLREAIDKGLVDFVAMDIKNSKEKYALTTGIQNIDIAPFEESVKILLDGRVDYEFRTTVVNGFHTTQDIESIAKWIKGAKAYHLQAFKDNFLLGDIHNGEVSESDMNKMAEIARQYLSNVTIRGI